MAKTPLAILLTDIHYHKDNIPQVNSICEQGLKLAIKLKVKVVFIMGDIFTDRTGQTLSVLLAFKGIIRKFSDKDIDLIIFPGNHCKTDQESEDSYLDIYSGMKNVFVIRDGHCVDLKKLLVYCLPYFLENGSYPGRLKKLSIEALKQDRNKVLLTHIAVSGVSNNDGSKVKNELGIKQFSAFDSVFVGHYHNRSKVGDNIYYIGSTHPQRYGEDNDKGFTILYNDGSHEYIQSDFKQYVKLSIDLATTSKKELKEIIEKYSDAEDKVRVVLKGTDEQLASIDSKQFAEVGIDLKKESENILKAVSAAENDEFINFDKKSILKAFNEFCKINEFSPVDKGKGLKYLSKI